MTAAWRKVVRDVWSERTRGALVVLSIAISLSGFMAVLSSYAILRRELNRSYLATNPASAVLLTDAIDNALLAAAATRDDISDADARRIVTGRIRTGPAAWHRLVLFVIRDFRQLRINTVTPEDGEWPPAPGAMLIERDAFQVANTRVGQTVTIELTAGGERTLRVAGRVHDAGQAQARMENLVYGYIAPETLERLGDTARLDRLSIIVRQNRLDEAHVRRVAEDVKTWLERRGHTVRRIDVPPPGEHPHAAIMGVLLLAMAAFGLFALVLSGAMVVNLLLAMMAAERRQIGVMKAIGGSRGQIACIYLAEAALFGGAAVVLAFPAGVVGGHVLSDRFAGLLNIDLLSPAVPASLYLLVGVVGVLVPLAAAAYPVAVATGMTVHAAISGASGLDPARVESVWLNRLFAGASGGSRRWLLGVRNSARRRTRTILTIAPTAAAGAFFISALDIRQSMMVTLDQRFGAGTYGAATRYALDQHMLMIYVFLLVAAGLLATVGSLGLVTATRLNVLERRRELGVLRAIGASPGMVGGIVIVEAVFVSVLAWLIAVLAAWPIGAITGRFLTLALFPSGLDIAFSPTGIFSWLAISTALAVAFSLAPALSASRRSVLEAVSHE